MPASSTSSRVSFRDRFVTSKTDVHVAMLGTAACQPAMIPQALPILKQFVQDITTRSGEASVDDFVVAQLRCCLRRFLAIYANAQKRETTASLACVKNTLLASTILLTGSTNVIPAEDASVQRLLDDLVECLDDRMVPRLVHPVTCIERCHAISIELCSNRFRFRPRRSQFTASVLSYSVVLEYLPTRTSYARSCQGWPDT